MTFKVYSKQFLILSTILITGVIGINIYFNEFGLYGNVKGKPYKIHAYEKVSKYLYTYNYIPSNFDSVIIGPSYSNNNMNPSKIINYKSYNLSMSGANIDEIQVSINNLIKYHKELKLVIFSINPYIVDSIGFKEFELSDKLMLSTLGSIVNIKYYTKKYINNNKCNTYKYSENGYRNTECRDNNSTYEINKKLNELNKRVYDLKINNLAILKLKKLLIELSSKKFNLLVYYHPYPLRVYNNKYFQSKYKYFYTETNNLLLNNNISYIDFNDERYNYITSDDDTFSDSGHLSENGASKIFRVLNNKLK